MGRIPDEDIQRLKRDISLEQLVRSRGIDLRRTGANLLGLCPFHDDHEPSLVITPDSNLWHCLGACQAGGSVIDFVMKAEGVSFRHAVELLRRGADLAESGQPKPVVKGPASPQARAARGPRGERRRAARPGRGSLPREPARERRRAALPARAWPRARRPRRDISAGVREPHARVPAAGESAQGGAALAYPAGAARRLARHGARAPARFAGGAALGHRGRGGAALRAEDRRPHRA
ncbi:MAG: hypothetical protein IPG04_09370 [Polyangiaceae bacterium]|nr:hypothetical protein [Polyangiaceae bacterium]